MPRLLYLLLTAALATAATPSLTLQVSSETAPPGGYAQFKISLTSPALVSTAAISMTFDPTVFGPIANVAAFGATEDQIGYAHVSGTQLTAFVRSSSASLGQLPGLPIFVVTVPILASASPASRIAITVDPTASPWQDPQGNTYAVSVSPGSFLTGPLSVQSVAPGGGPLPSGTVITIAGTGFDPATTVTIDGVGLVSTQFVSPQQINATLDGSTELTGKHLHVLTGSGAQTDFFCSLSSAPANNAAATVFPLLPLTTYTNVSWEVPDDADFQESIVLLNQNLFPVTMTLFSGGFIPVLLSPSVTIPPGELYLIPLSIGLNYLDMVSSAPMRMMEYRVNGDVPGSLQYFVFPPETFEDLLGSSVSPSAASWNWQIGSTAPAPTSIEVYPSFPFTVITSAPWLSVSPTQGTGEETIVLTPNVSGLSIGTYSGTVTVKTTVPASLSPLTVPDVVIPVSIQVSASPFITASGGGYFTATAGSVTPSTSAISVATSGTPAQFSVSVNTSSGGNWLSVTPFTGTTPGSINVIANPSGLPPGTYTGNVVIQGPANSITLSQEMVIAAAVSTQPAPPTLSPSTFSFALAAGTKTQYQFAGSANFTLASGSAQTQSGGNWLSVITTNGLYFDLDATKLSPGTYLGTINLVTTTGASVPVTITLIVLTPSAPLTVTPASVALTLAPGQSATQMFTVTSNPGTLYTYTGFTPNPQVFGMGGSASSTYTPATVQISFYGSQPGTNYSSVTFTSGSYSVTVPVVLTVTASPALPPILGSVVSAASATPSAISPGDIITLFGTGIGSTPSGLKLDSTGKVATTLNGTQVMINNIAAPLIYASSSQINAIVPYEVGSTETATVQVLAGGLPSGIWAVPLAPAAPSIFTVNQTGVGQGAIVNADGSINSPSNPASRGSTIQIYATGGGQTIPASSTGTVAPTAAMLSLPVAVTIGGVNAQVLYAGNAPGEVEGVVQVNAVVPQSATPGILPILVTIGAAGATIAQPGATIAVQ